MQKFQVVTLTSYLVSTTFNLKVQSITYLMIVFDNLHVILLQVTSVSEDVVLDKEAYILFYAREGTPWFSSIVEDEQCDPKSILDASNNDFGLEDKENDEPPPGFG